MKIRRRLVRKWIAGIGPTRRFWNHYRFWLFDAPMLQVCRIGENCAFNDRVRSGGYGTLEIGEECMFGYEWAPGFRSTSILLQPRTHNSLISVSPGCQLSNNVSLVACDRITLGKRCLIGDGVLIVDSDFHGIQPDQRHLPGESMPVDIGDNVWIGSRSLVLKGVTIGNNSIVGAGSVVTRPIPANCIAAGNPAKALRDLG